MAHRRRDFSAAIKRAAWERSDGRCECGCGVRIVPGDGPEFDHRIEDILFGEPTLDNCVVKSRRCHREKTTARAPVIAKARRIEKRQANIKPRKRLIPGSKGSGLRKKFDGSVWRE